MYPSSMMASIVCMVVLKMYFRVVEYCGFESEYDDRWYLIVDFNTNTYRRPSILLARWTCRTVSDGSSANTTELFGSGVC